MDCLLLLLSERKHIYVITKLLLDVLLSYLFLVDIVLNPGGSNALGVVETKLHTLMLSIQLYHSLGILFGVVICMNRASLEAVPV
jgi:hypothetical protein